MKPIKLLHIDDSLGDRILFRKALERTPYDGYQIQGASSLKEALTFLHKHQPDIIILDHSIPAENTFESLATIKSSLPNVPIIIYSSYSDTNVHEKYYHHGATSFIHKLQSDGQHIDGIIRNLLFSKKCPLS